MKRHVTKALTISIALVLAAPLTYAAGSGSMSGGSGVGSAGATSAPSMTPQQRAANSYNAGLKHKKRAQEYEAKAAGAANDKDRQKQLGKAQDQYKDSIDDYKKAIGYDMHAYQAMNEMGYAYRKIGDYEMSVKAYNTALAVKPDFTPAIEYRAEAYLALALYGPVKEAYLALFAKDQDQAATLMQAMEAWLATHQEDASPDARAFSAWILERKAVAVNTQTLSSNNVHAWN